MKPRKAYAVFTAYKGGHIARNTCRKHCLAIFDTRKDAEAECGRSEEVIRVVITPVE